MRLNTAAALFALTLPSFSTAQDQIPLMDHAKGIISKVQDITQNGFVDRTPRYHAPNVIPLTMDNWKSVLKHSGKTAPYDPPEAWMVYITADEKTCQGHCDMINPAWNQSVALFEKDVSAPKLAQINCDTDEILCGAWAARVGTVWVILLPQPLPDQSAGPTRITIHQLNYTTATNADITKIHTRRTYLSAPEYEGVMHPFDGWIAKYGLTNPMAYTLYALSKTPSWTIMLVVVGFSRYWTSKHMPRPGVARAPAGSAPAGSAPAPAS